MASSKSVIINGRAYDSVTGLPIEPIAVTNPDKTPVKKPAPAPAKKPEPSTTRSTANADMVHKSPVQRSQTLHRRAAKKPVAPQKVVTRRNTPGRHMDIARSANVSKFAKHPEVKPTTAASTVSKAPKPLSTPVAKPTAKPVARAATKTAPSKPVTQHDKPAQVHPVAERALKRNESKKRVAPAAAKPKSSKEIKDEAISKALAAPAAPKKTKKKARKNILKQNKHLRTGIIIAVSLIVLVLAAFAVYRLVPTISVSVAASQAGINATYPEFTPDGYALDHPVTYTDGEVDLRFASNSNDNYYTITQTRSSWDSSAVLDNIVTPVAGANYITTKERGLTIYTYGSSAAWVNGGILYKIDSKAPLSGDQIRRIATSL